MNAEIMSLCNSLVYNNKLKCGSDAVATRRLKLSRPIASSTPAWVQACIDPESPVIFLDTDQLQGN